MPRVEDGSINLRELVRSLAEDVVNVIMDAEADQLCSSGANSRNGYRERNLATCVGDITMRIPKLRSGSRFNLGTAARGQIPLAHARNVRFIAANQRSSNAHAVGKRDDRSRDKGGNQNVPAIHGRDGENNETDNNANNAHTFHQHPLSKRLLDKAARKARKGRVGHAQAELVHSGLFAIGLEPRAVMDGCGARHHAARHVRRHDHLIAIAVDAAQIPVLDAARFMSNFARLIKIIMLISVETNKKFVDFYMYICQTMFNAL